MTKQQLNIIMQAKQRAKMRRQQRNKSSRDCFRKLRDKLSHSEGKNHLSQYICREDDSQKLTSSPT